MLHMYDRFILESNDNYFDISLSFQPASGQNCFMVPTNAMTNTYSKCFLHEIVISAGLSR